MNIKSAIGIFDSGMGGLSVLDQAIKELPNENFIYYGDSKNAPYGIKSKEEVIKLSIEICDYFISRDVKAILVACNTATSAAIDVLRSKYSIPIIGMEPAIKPAILNNKGKYIAVMATPMTLREEKFTNLLGKLETAKKIFTIPAPKLVEIVEKGIVSGDEIDIFIKEYFFDIPVDLIESVVLGCTHFIFIKDAIRKYFGTNVELFDGNEGTIHELIRQLNKNSLLNKVKLKSNIEIINTAGKDFEKISRILLKNIQR